MEFQMKQNFQIQNFSLIDCINTVICCELGPAISRLVPRVFDMVLFLFLSLTGCPEGFVFVLWI